MTAIDRLELDPGQNGVLNTAERIYDNACLAVIGQLASSLEEIDDLKTVDEPKATYPLDTISRRKDGSVVLSSGYADEEDTILDMRVMGLNRDVNGRIVNIVDSITQSARDEGGIMRIYRFDRASYPPNPREDTTSLSLGKVAFTLLMAKARQKVGLGLGWHKKHTKQTSVN